MTEFTVAVGNTCLVPDRNVLRSPLKSCGTDQLAGFYRGCCATRAEDCRLRSTCAESALAGR